jgi:ATP-dependent Clp endopeptidase proteolytic subunit ClpP
MIGKKKMQNKFPAMDDFVGADDKIGLRFLDNNVHFLMGDIEEENIKKAIQWIAYENLTDDKDKVLTLYISSYGGDLYQAFGLIDMMRISKYPVATIGVGSIMSAAFMIFAAGQKGRRMIAKNTGIMCHQFSDYAEGKFHDLKSQAKANDICNQRMIDILREASGLPERTIKTKLLGPTDVWLTPEELVQFKIADRII